MSLASSFGVNLGGMEVAKGADAISRHPFIQI